MKKQKIGLFQSGILTFFITRSFLITGLIPLILSISKENSLISILLGSIIGLIPLILFSILRKRQREHHIFEFIDFRFSPVFAFLLKIIILISSIFMGSFLLSSFARYISMNYLKDTSYFIILVSLLITLYSVCKNGIQTVARCAEILIFVWLFLFFFSLIGLSPTFDTNLLKPFFHHALPATFESAFLYSLSSSIPLFLLTLIPNESVRSHKRLTKTTILGYLLACFSILLSFLVIIGTLGIDLATYFPYPETTVLKKISYFQFIERVEGILSIQWFLDITVTLSLLFTFLKTGIDSFSFPKPQIVFFIALISLLFLSNRITIPLRGLLFILTITFLLLSFLCLLQDLWTKKTS